MPRIHDRAQAAVVVVVTAMARKKPAPAKAAEVDHNKVADLHQATATLAALNGDPLAALAAQSAALLHRQEAKKTTATKKNPKKGN